jgi:hypothetical protein
VRFILNDKNQMSKGASIRVGSSEPENAKKIEGQRSSFGGTARKSVTLIHVMFHFPRKFPGNSQENPRKFPGEIFHREKSL